MEIQLPIAQERFLMRLVEEGTYSTVEEALCAAIQTLERSECSREPGLEELKTFISAGADQAKAGDTATVTLDDIRNEGMEVLNRRRGVHGA